jgi:hypothetical protein
VKTITNTIAKGGIRFTKSNTRERNNTIKGTKKFKTTNKKTINNTTEKERGFDSSKVVPRVRSNTKGH